MRTEILTAFSLLGLAGISACSRGAAPQRMAPIARVVVTPFLAHDSLSIAVADQVRDALPAALPASQWQIVPRADLETVQHVYPGLALEPNDLALIGEQLRADVVIDVRAGWRASGVQVSATAIWPGVRSVDSMTVAVVNAPSPREAGASLVRAIARWSTRLRRPPG